MSTCYHNFRTLESDPKLAVSALIHQLGTDRPSIVFLFVDADYNLPGLADELQSRIHGPILACTTAGGLTREGYVSGGVVGGAICSNECRASIHLIPELDKFDVERAEKFASTVKLPKNNPNDATKRFGVMLVDGLCRCEERISALLHGALNGLPIVGGSAGDNLAFSNTQVFDGHKFRTNIAALGIIETSLPFEIFRFHHFEAGPDRAVITDADSSKRLILEINGAPAEAEYGDLIHCQGSLDSQLVATHPFLVKVANGEFFARSIQSWKDGALGLYCGIEPGMVVHVGNAGDIVKSLESEFESLHASHQREGLTVAFDCVLRRIEVQSKGLDHQVSRAVSDYPVVGFSTYGEQFDGMHINQTMTGVCFGG